MERHGHLDLDACVKDKLLTMSARVSIEPWSLLAQRSALSENVVKDLEIPSSAKSPYAHFQIETTHH